MSPIQIHPIAPTYIRPAPYHVDVFDFDSIATIIRSEFKYIPTTIFSVLIQPHGFGGNHAHPRTETWLALGPLELRWLDLDQKERSMKMCDETGYKLITIAPDVPHVVINNNDFPITLLEWASGPMVDVKPHIIHRS